jgi:D-glycero-alpha-D-manno-heptose 1-phosphate guanylyltransferase
MRSLPKITAVVLAGGQGTRIRHLLPECPKPMARVQGRPFIDWIVRFLVNQGIGNIIISTGYKGEQIEAYFQSHPLPETEIICVRELVPRGTAGGFLTAIASAPVPEGWLICNGDSLLLTSLDPLFTVMQTVDVSVALLGVSMPDASSYGTLEFDMQHRLQRFAEKRPGPGIVNAGVYFFRSAVCDTFPTIRPLSFETDLFPFLLASGIHLQVVQASGPFLDIGLPETLRLAEAFIGGNSNFFNPPRTPLSTFP